MPAEDIEPGQPREAAESAPARPKGATVSIPLSTIGWSVALAVATVLAVVFGALWWSARDDLDERDARAADERRAEQVATDYAVGAATVNYQDVTAWVGKLKANTTPQLATKFDATAPKLEQILVPLKWTSTASPIAAEVASEADGTYKVNVFVNVTSTNAQSPEGAQTTVTYTVTLDKNADWKITDVGGVDGALPIK
ncbi:MULTISPECIES: hypothetical protein [Nocardia]|uniref:Mce-associated membrane protein n=1 Tax=Nocardia farcinica TaxID=37329 RepID=A0A449H7Q0_NOCFR|nr:MULTISPECIES: hypothetical protein [Nocardia]MBF6187129.1 hypothetical protein [Nocardia farcinica]MBF6312777.1 hypothetical protein [Nocardia farcinica]MBF6408368.1 hypothetical protein [Nocardia farcinica]PEH78838.1 hypothetical protein CRM89_25035 [Nocardia sp. FDAARGOS_372]UEX23458.1 hypothetical protein LMJ57_02825 [Nocardia farcinica]